MRDVIVASRALYGLVGLGRQDGAAVPVRRDPPALCTTTSPLAELSIAVPLGTRSRLPTGRTVERLREVALRQEKRGRTEANTSWKSSVQRASACRSRPRLASIEV